MAGDIYFNNVTGRFDWGSVVEQIIRAKSIPLQKLSQEAQQIQAKQSALQGLAGAMGDLSKLFENLNMDELFRGKKANSSDSSVLTATAKENTPNVTLNLSVSKLAQKEALVTEQGISDINSSISWSAFQIAYNTGSSTLYFDVQAGSGKLSDLVSAINGASGSKIVASTFYDGSQYKLMLSERDEASSTAETGGGNTVISFNLAPVINGNTWNLDNANPLQSAQNAQISIGSNTLTSPSNRFENIIDGLSVEVKKQGNATITVNEDYSAVSKFLGDFVRSYNAVISQVNQLTGKDALFQGDYSITGIKTELSRMLDKLFANDLVNIKEDGTLEVNSSAVNSLASSNPQRLREAITDLKNTMGGYALRTSTTLQSFSNDFQSRLDQMKQRADVLGQQLLQEERRLKLEYAKVEAFMDKAQEVMGRLQTFMVSLSESQKRR